MEELYAEGLASCGGPQSCVDDPKGRGEALAGARAGRAMEPRNHLDRGADAVQKVEGNIAGGVMRELPPVIDVDGHAGLVAPHASASGRYGTGRTAAASLDGCSGCPSLVTPRQCRRTPEDSSTAVTGSAWRASSAGLLARQANIY
jgi:hypothetical protein